MKCIVCGRTDDDIAEMESKLIEKIEKILEMLEKGDPKHTRDQKAEINNEIKVLKQYKETLGNKVSFVDVNIFCENFSNMLVEKNSNIIEKYLVESVNNNDYKLCSRCVDRLSKYKVFEENGITREDANGMKSQIFDLLRYFCNGYI
jgi:uncharacterized coiled-coil DUF342 family protein